MAAHRLSIDVVNQMRQPVLFDTNILINAFSQRVGPVFAHLVRVNKNQRFTIDHVLWEFLRPGAISDDEIERRARWLKDQTIRLLDAWTPTCRDAFRWLRNQRRHRGEVTDGVLAACGTANRDWVVATRDADDFLPLDRVALVDEFLA